MPGGGEPTPSNSEDNLKKDTDNKDAEEGKPPSSATVNYQNGQYNYDNEAEGIYTDTV